MGHEIENDYHSILVDNHSGFKFDGEDIWKHLKRNGIVIESSFMSGKPNACNNAQALSPPRPG